MNPYAIREMSRTLSSGAGSFVTGSENELSPCECQAPRLDNHPVKGHFLPHAPRRRHYPRNDPVAAPRAARAPGDRGSRGAVDAHGHRATSEASFEHDAPSAQDAAERGLCRPGRRQPRVPHRDENLRGGGRRLERERDRQDGRARRDRPHAEDRTSRAPGGPRHAQRRRHTQGRRRGPLALGKVMLAFKGPGLAKRYIARMPFKALTPNTITNPRDFERELDRIRAQGYAVDNEEYAIGMRCVAAPVFNFSGKAVAAMGISG